MKIVSESISISKATQKIQGAISDRSLAQIGIRADKGQVTFFAADRMLAIYSSFDGNITQPGITFVQAKLFTEVVRELPPETITLSTEGSWLVVTGGKNNSYTMKIPILEGLSWKEPPDTTEDAKAYVPSIKLSYLINQVSFCVSQESPRNYGSVAYLHKCDETKLRLVGTDGYRLSHCDVEVELNSDFLKQGLCLPKRTLVELSKVCQEGFESVELSISNDGSIICASVDGFQMFARLSSIKYPNYQGVIPNHQPHQLSLSRSELQSVTKRVLIAADKNKALLLSFSKDSLTLSSKTMGSSEGTESVPLDGYVGEDCQIAVNGKFLSDVFSVTSSEELSLAFSNNVGPIVTAPMKEPEGCFSRHVLVPIMEAH